jgi:hypothetical protein
MALRAFLARDGRRLVLPAWGDGMNSGDNKSDGDPQHVGRNCTRRGASLSWRRRRSGR